jgi:hypothetical protein
MSWRIVSRGKLTRFELADVTKLASGIVILSYRRR